MLFLTFNTQAKIVKSDLDNFNDDYFKKVISSPNEHFIACSFFISKREEPIYKNITPVITSSTAPLINSIDACPNNINDLFFATPCYVNGARTNNANEGAIVAFNYETRGQGQSLNYLSNVSEVGTVWGLEYNPVTNHIFTSAFVKRHADLPPDGLGAIYTTHVTDALTNGPNSGATNLWLDINNPTTFTDINNNPVNLGFPTDPGATSRELGAKSAPSHDIWAYDKVGRQGIGDISFSKDYSRLYVMDLTNKQLLIIDVVMKQLIAAIPVPNPGCGNANDVRPWAVREYNDKVYIGVVCSGETSQNNPGFSIMSLDDINNPTSFSSEFFVSNINNRIFTSWQPWPTDHDNHVGTNLPNYHERPSPFISDIEFDAFGNMIIGIGDIAGHLYGHQNYPPTNDNYTFGWLTTGEITRAEWDGANWNPIALPYSYAYETRDHLQAIPTFIGGLSTAACADSAQVIGNVVDPFEDNSAGPVWTNADTGDKEGGTIASSALEIIPNINAPDNFGKAAGLGDLDLFTTTCNIHINDPVLNTCIDNGNGTYTSFYTSSISWSQPPSVEEIEIYLNGNLIKTFDPSAFTSPHEFDFDVPADGNGTQTIVAQFANTTSCSDDLVMKSPTPCPLYLGDEPGQICINAAGFISGTVWEDWNYNGAMDEINIIGVQGIQVLLTDDCGTTISTTYTDSSGNYEFSGLSNGTPYRVEFLLPETVACWAKPTRTGIDNGSTIQFVEAGNCAHLGIASPSDYCQDNPLVALACYVNGTATGGGSIDAFVSLDYTSSGENPTIYKDAEIQEIGATWGAAYQATTKQLFTTSFLKRHVGLKGSTGDIFTLDYSATPATVVGTTDLNNTSPANIGDAISGGVNILLGNIDRSSGSDYTLAAAPNLSDIDLDAFAKVGAISYGDADLTEDGKTLWVVNLNQKGLIQIDVSNGSIGTTNQYLINQIGGIPNCTNGELRPFGLSFHRNKGYLGVVCDASVSQNKTDLIGYILSFDPNNIANGFSTELTIDFADYRPDHVYWDMEPWVNTWAQTGYNTTDGVNNGVRHIHVQPMISDITFDETGSMIVGVMDRLGHQTGFFNNFAVPGGGTANNEDGRNRGTIIRTCNINGAFVIENNSTCGNNFFDGIGFNNGADGAYYVLKSGDASPTAHAGGLLSIPGKGDLISPLADPFDPDSIGVLPKSSTFYTHGLHWLRHNNGAHEDWTVLIQQGTAGQTSKANGLGDPVAICNPAPIEIGNYVWEDSDGDGIQDACEAPLEGIFIALYKRENGAIGFVDSVRTDVNGQYYFRELDGTQDSLKTGVEYTITVGQLMQYNTATQRLEFGGRGLTLTYANQGSNIEIDSDGVPYTTDPFANFVNYPSATFIMGEPGCMDHSIDFGFRPTCEMTVNFMQSDCNNNGTNNDETDDYFTVTFDVTNTYAGNSNTFEVLLDGILIGEATYGTPKVFNYADSGQSMRFKADGASTYTFTIRDKDDNVCLEEVTSLIVQECSDCPQICLPVNINKQMGS